MEFRYVRHGTSIVVGIALIKYGLDMVEKGEYLFGAIYCLAGSVLIIYDYYSGLKHVERKVLSKVRQWF